MFVRLKMASICIHPIVCVDTYEMPLPACLPPTHRGKAFKISYKVEIVLQLPDLTMQTFSFPVHVFHRVNGTFITMRLMTCC